MMTAPPIGFPWFESRDYPRLRDLFSDGDRLPPSFGAWQAAAEEALRLFREQGLPVVQVRIEPDSFQAWCMARAVSTDYRARHQFATEAIRRAAAA